MKSHFPKGKKKRISFAAAQRRDLDPADIQSRLGFYKTAVKICCSLACFSWLNVAIVVYCRSQYVALESHKKRAEWLKKKFESITHSDMPFSSTIHMDYANEVRWYQQQRCCVEAFDFA